MGVWGFQLASHTPETGGLEIESEEISERAIMCFCLFEHPAPLSLKMNNK